MNDAENPGRLPGRVVALLLIAMVLAPGIAMILHSPRVSLGAFELHEISEIAAELERSGFERDRDFFLEDSSGSITARADRRNEIMLRLSDLDLLPKSARKFTDAGKSESTEPDQEHRLRMLEARRTEVRRILRSRRGIANAEISVPFIEQADSGAVVTASAAITFDSGFTPTGTDLAEIRELIVTGIPGLESRNLTLVDGATVLLESNSDSPARARARPDEGR